MQPTAVRLASVWLQHGALSGSGYQVIYTDPFFLKVLLGCLQLLLCSLYCVGGIRFAAGEFACRKGGGSIIQPSSLQPVGRHVMHASGCMRFSVQTLNRVSYMLRSRVHSCTMLFHLAGREGFGAASFRRRQPV